METIGWGAVAIAVCGGVFMPLIIGFFSYKEKQLKIQREIAIHGGEELKRELASARAEIQSLRERMAVVERLVTDDDRRLSSEIDRLSGTSNVKRV